MSALRQFLARCRALFRRARLERDMADEMRFHLEEQTDEHIAEGLPPDAARQASQLKFGNLGAIQEAAREVRSFVWLEQLRQDLRFALRSLARSPGFTAVALLTLALSLGACLTIYSVVDSLLLHPLDNPDPDRLVTMRSKRPSGADLAVSPADFLDWQASARSFTAIAARSAGILTLTGEGEATRMRTVFVSANYFDVLQIAPELGRGFLPEETDQRPAHVVLIGHALWQTRFGGQPDVLGRTLQLNEESYTIVGVLPENIERAGGLPGWNDIALPLVFNADWLRARDARGGSLMAEARLKPGVTLEQARAEMDVLSARLARQYPDTNHGIGAIVTSFGEAMTRPNRPALWSLFGAVSGVLLIACANLASLLLVRATVRQREISLRTAFGATRARLIRFLLTESLVLSLAGGGLGTLLAAGAIRLLAHLRFHSSVGLAGLALVKLDPAMLVVALALSVGTGLIFGLAPAWMASRCELSGALKSGARGATETGARGKLRSALVVFEVAAALMLLVATGLLMRSFARLADFDPGFDPRPVAYANVTLQGSRYVGATSDDSDRKVRLWVDSALTRLRALPGVQSASASLVLPAITVGDAGTDLTFSIAGRPELPVYDRPKIQRNISSPDFFATLGIRVHGGRTFDERDNESAPRVTVINETAARLYFAGADPIGQRLRFDDAHTGDWYEVVGVVADTVFLYGQERGAQAYVPFAQVPSRYLHFAVRTSGDPAIVAPMLAPQFHALDPNLAVPWAAPMTQTIASLSTLARQRFILQLLGSFSAIALVIAMVGIYGVISYSVSRRTTEFGIRLALGADRADVLRLVLGQGARLIGLGLLLGLAGSIAAGRALATMLYQTSAWDPLTILIVMGLLGGTALLACWLPARRATKVDPMVALRAE